MRFFNRIEVRLSLLMMLVVATSLITIALNTYQRERTLFQPHGRGAGETRDRMPAMIADNAHELRTP